jgi:mutator protein MutT
VIHVVAGALVAADGRVLIADRPPGKRYAGRWEFPGGKLAPGESPGDALRRELVEELGIEVTRAQPLIKVRHHYPGDAAAVLIDCWRVAAWRGEPAGLDGQSLRWCTREQLAEADILEADRPIVVALRLPRIFIHAGQLAVLGAHAQAAPGRERTAWLVNDAPADPALLEHLAARGDALFVVDPEAMPAAVTGAVYTTARRPPRGPRGHGLAGCVVHCAAEAVAAAGRGEDFLLVPDRGLAITELAGIAQAGLPWYLNVAEPACGDAPAPTGTLWWKAAARAARP